MSKSSGLYFDDSMESSTAKDMGDKTNEQLLPSSKMSCLPNLGATAFTINLKRPRVDLVQQDSTPSASKSRLPPLRAPGLSFTLSLNFKNPQAALGRPAVPLSPTKAHFDGKVDESQVDSEAESQTDSDEASTNQGSDGEESRDMEEDHDEIQSMDEDLQPMLYRIEREETRGDSFLNCRDCGSTFDYSRLSLWVPSYQRTPPRGLQMPNENTHPQIVRCPVCDAENCMACENSPHDESCTFAHARVVWHALCTVDDAIIQHRKRSPRDKDTKNLDSAVIKALETLLQHMAIKFQASFGYCDLLRKSMLLDQVAVTICNMVPENQFDTVCLQSWAFINMISRHDDLHELLFEDRLQFLRNMSPGVRVLGFPISFFSVPRTYDADRYAPQTYTLWSLIRQTRQSAHEYLSADTKLHDEWPAVMLARSIVSLHDDLDKKRQSPLPELITFVQAQKLTSFEARLEEMHRVEGTKFGAVQGNNRMALSFSHIKKRGQDQLEVQDRNEEVMGRKRRKDHLSSEI